MQLISRLTAILLMVALGTATQAADLTARSGGPSSSQMTGRASGPADGIAFFRPVLSGVLYRSGFQGGDKARTGLNTAQRGALCEAGFSGARYIDFGKHTQYGTTQCGGNSMTYEAGRSTRPADIMRQIHDIVVRPEAGPLLVHCMWGVHSSGAISAMALVQFCDWSEDRAKAYWNDARNGAGCSGGCDAWIDKHFDTFTYDPALKISASQQAAICPK